MGVSFFKNMFYCRHEGIRFLTILYYILVHNIGKTMVHKNGIDVK